MTDLHRRFRYQPRIEILEDRLTPSVSITEFSAGITGGDTGGITAGPDGNVWFTEPSANLIGRITPAGVVTEFPDPGGDNPGAITTGPDGNLWFTESNAQVGRITLAGVVTHFATSMAPSGFYQSITVGPDGNLWFTEDAGIGRITTAGVVTEFTSGISSSPEGITAGPDGNLWFTETGFGGDFIGRITTTGIVTEFNNGLLPFGTPAGITAGPDGNLWFTESFEDQIGRITTQGVITEFQQGITCCSSPFGITLGPDGNLWFTERQASQIGEITPQGVVTEYSDGITFNSNPVNITTGPDGNLWFTEQGEGQIGRVSGVPSATQTTLSTSGSPSIAGQPVTFTADVTLLNPVVTVPVAGAVTFLDDGIPLGTSSVVNGVATFSIDLSVGTHAISAVFVSSGNFSPSTAATIGQTVNAPPTPPPIFAVGADAGGGPQVNVYDAQTGALVASFDAFAPSFRGGVRLAVGDVNGDGTDDIICGAGPGGGPQVAVYDGKTFQLLASFYAFAPTFTGGVFVAAGDISDEGFADIVCGAGAGGGPQVTVFDGKDDSLLASFYAFAPTFTGGVRVAVGDINGDNRADIITAAGPGGGPQVTVFNGINRAILESFDAFAPTFTGGVFVAAGDVNGDGHADVITGAGPGGGPQITTFSGKDGSVLASFYDPRFGLTIGVSTGIRVGTVTVNGQVEILAAPGPGAPALVDVFNSQTLGLLDSFFAFDPAFRGGAFVAG